MPTIVTPHRASAASEAPTRPHLPIDPRIYQRLLDVRRAEGHRRLQVLAAVSVAIVLVAGVIGVLHTPLARVRHVRVIGAPAVPPSSVLRTLGLDRQVLMVDVAPAAYARRLEAIPLVATARVQRQWPATIRVLFTARSGVAVVASGASREVLDRTGRVLAVGPAVGSGLPLLNAQVSAVADGRWVVGTAGPGAAALAATAPGVAASSAAPADDRLAAELAMATAAAGPLPGRLSSISVTAADGLVATLGSTTIVFGDTTDLPAKITGLAAVLAHGPLAQVGVVDLRVADRPALVFTHCCYYIAPN